jgi:hypothetical protein
VALVHGQAEPDVDTAEAELHSGVEGAGAARDSSVFLERNYTSSDASVSNSWDFFEERTTEDDGQKRSWQKIREFSYQQSAREKPTTSTEGGRKTNYSLNKNEGAFFVADVNSPKARAKDTDVKNFTKDESDSNYFDELTFKESLNRFSEAECNKPREIIYESKQFSTELKGLSALDRQYFLRSQQLDQIENVDAARFDHNLPVTNKLRAEIDLAAVKSEPLNYFDEQLFADAPHRVELPTGLGKISKQAKSAEISDKEIKVVKKLPKDRTKAPSSALEYVRKLRKGEVASGAGAVVSDPVDSVGVGLVARVAAATATLHSSVQVTPSSII